MAWWALGGSVVSALTVGGCLWLMSSLSRRVGALEAANAQLESEVKWLRRRAAHGALPPLTGSQSVHVLRGLSDGPDAA